MRSSHERSSSRRWRSAISARSPSGATTRNGPTSSTTSSMCSSPGNGTATTATIQPSIVELGRQYGRTPPQQLVFCSQNHDQVGNRALGDRPRADELALRAAALLWSPQTPLLFMGEEYGERRPFQYFTDHTDPAIAEATREGRAKEFAQFTAFSGENVPDPQDRRTFERSKLAPEAGDPAASRAVHAADRAPSSSSRRSFAVGGRRDDTGRSVCDAGRRSCCSTSRTGSMKASSRSGCGLQRTRRGRRDLRRAISGGHGFAELYDAPSGSRSAYRAGTGR